MFLSLCGKEEMPKKYKGKKHKVLLGYKTGSLDAGQEEYKEKTKGEMRINLHNCMRKNHTFFPVSFGSIGSSSGFNERINESITETIMYLEK